MNTLSLIRFFAVEDKPSRQGTAQLPQTGERLLAGRVTAYVEGTLASDPNLYIVALFQFKRLDDSGGQAKSPGLFPTLKPHRAPPSIQYPIFIYTRPNDK